MKLFSNGFFVDRDIYMNTCEDTEFEYIGQNKDETRVPVSNFFFSLNDLRDLEGINFLKQHYITDEEYDSIALNCFVVYKRDMKAYTDELIFRICIYNGANTSEQLYKFLEKLNFQIDIVINTEQERNKFFDLLNDYFNVFGFDNIEEYIEKASKSNDEYNSNNDYLVDKRDVLYAIKKVADKGTWADYNEFYNEILQAIYKL